MLRETDSAADPDGEANVEDRRQRRAAANTWRCIPEPLRWAHGEGAKGELTRFSACTPSVGQKNEPRPYQLILGYGGFEQGRCSFGPLTHHQTLVRPAGSLEVPPSGPCLLHLACQSIYSESVRQFTRIIIWDIETYEIETPSRVPSTTAAVNGCLIVCLIEGFE